MTSVGLRREMLGAGGFRSRLEAAALQIREDLALASVRGEPLRQRLGPLGAVQERDGTADVDLFAVADGAAVEHDAVRQPGDRLGHPQALLRVRVPVLARDLRGRPPRVAVRRERDDAVVAQQVAGDSGLVQDGQGRPDQGFGLHPRLRRADAEGGCA